MEEVGFYDPLTKQRNLKGDRVKYWLSVGAKASPTVHNMLVTDKVVEGPKIAKHKLSKKPASPDASQGGPASPAGGPASPAVGQAVPLKAEETPLEPENKP